jgi:hypothetical protein
MSEREGINALIDAAVIVQKLREENAQLREALRESAERFHGLSDDPVHLAHIFAVCPSRECSEARAALEDTR